MLSPLLKPTRPQFQDEFTYHWNQCDWHVNNSQLTNQSIEAVFLHAKHVVALVADEIPVKDSQSECRGSTAVDFGPLFSTAVKDKFFDKLLIWVEGRFSPQDPSGIQLRDLQRKHLLDLFDYLITQSRQAVLDEIIVLRPLLQFIFKLSSQLRPTYAQEYAQLLHSICVLVCRSNSFLSFCKKLSQDLFEDAYMVFSLLVPLIHRADKVGDRARDAALLVLSLSREDESLADYLAFQSDFCPVLAASLSGLYSSLPKKLVPRHSFSNMNLSSHGGKVTLKTSAVLETGLLTPFLLELPVGGPSWHQLSQSEYSQSDDLRQLLHTLEFCDLVIKVSHIRVQTQLMYFINSGFLIPVLSSALHQNALTEVVAATAYLELFLRHLTGPRMIKLFLHFIITGTHDGVPILMSLINRIKANAEVVTDIMHQLGMVTISLFRTILSFHSEDVMYELVFKHLMPLHHLVQGGSASPCSTPDSHRQSQSCGPANVPSTPRCFPAVSHLAVNLLHSADRFVALATTAIRDGDEPSGDTSSLSQSNCSIDESLDFVHVRLPSDPLDRGIPRIPIKRPDLRQYIAGAARRVEIAQAACRGWKLNYSGSSACSDECSPHMWTDEELANFELENMTELHASPCKSSNATSVVASCDPSFEAIQTEGRRFEFGSIYQLNYLSDISDEEVQPREPQAHSSPSISSSVSQSYQHFVSPSHTLPALKKTTRCSCIISVPSVSHSYPESVSMDLFELNNFLRFLDDFNLPWDCSLHFDHLPKFCILPPLDPAFISTLDDTVSVDFDPEVPPANKISSTVNKNLSLSVLTDKSASGSTIRSTNSPIVGGIGPFLSILLDRLNSLHTNCLFTNLLLTDLFAALASYPCPLLYSFLLDSVGSRLKPNLKSVYKILHSVHSQISATASSLDNWSTLVTRAYIYFNRDLISASQAVVDPNFYSLAHQTKNNNHAPGPCNLTSTPMCSFASNQSAHQTISPLLPVSPISSLEFRPQSNRTSSRQVKTIWTRAASVVPLQRSPHGKSSNPLIRQSRLSRIVSRVTLSDSENEEELTDASEINAKLRNAVFGAVILDEFCYELAAICYCHSLRAIY